MNRVVTAGIAALGFLCLTLFAGVAHAQDEGDDSIRKKDNSTVTGKIQGNDLKGCHVKVGKAEITVPWPQIKSIEYAGSPTFKQARGYFDAGAIGEALPLLEKLSAETALRPVLRAEVANLLGACNVRSGEWDKAIATYTDLFKAFPGSQHLLDGGGENLINSYLAKNNAPGATDALKGILEGANKVGADTNSLNLLRGRVQEAGGDFAAAGASYKAVADSATDDGAKAAAELGIARCLFGQKKTGEAEAKFRGLVTRESAPWLVLAGAWNGLGDIMYRNGADKHDADLITDALLAYLRGCVLYTPLSGESTNEYERSVRGAYDCFTAMAQLEQNKDKKKLLDGRARERLELLRTKFPNSPYLPK